MNVGRRAFGPVQCPMAAAAMQLACDEAIRGRQFDRRANFGAVHRGGGVTATDMVGLDASRRDEPLTWLDSCDWKSRTNSI